MSLASQPKKSRVLHANDQEMISNSAEKRLGTFHLISRESSEYKHSCENLQSIALVGKAAEPP
jgi:hypothetical protein